MSLDIWLENPEKHDCPHCDGTGKWNGESFFSYNITHNLGTMAGKAGIYKHLWRPEEINIKVAGELIEPLTEGLQKLKSNPEYYKRFDAPNGWGKYEHLVDFIEAYLTACKEHPEAEIGVSR